MFNDLWLRYFWILSASGLWILKYTINVAALQGIKCPLSGYIDKGRCPHSTYSVDLIVYLVASDLQWAELGASFIFLLAFE